MGHREPIDAQLVTAGTLPVARGGTGGTTPATATATIGARDLAGIIVRADSTLTLTAGTGTTPNIKGSFVVAPAVTSFQFWAGNVLRTKTSADAASCTVEVPATQAQYYVYFDAAGTLAISTGVWDVTSVAICPVATIYWDPVTGAGVVADERHSAMRDRQLHEYLHHTRGTAYESGFVCTFTSTTMSVTQGIFYDEDIQHITSATPAAACRLWYRDATKSNRMQFESNVAVPYKATAGALKWDNNGTLTSVSSNQYGVNWVYATNDTAYPIAVVVGQANYANATAYNAASLPTITTLTTMEWKLLYKVVYQNLAGTPTYVTIADYRTASTIPSGGTSSVPASNVSYTPGGNIVATNVQTAIEELDTEKASSSYGVLFENGAGSAITVTTAGTFYGWVSATVGRYSGAPLVTYDIGSATADNLIIGTSGIGDYLVTLVCGYTNSGDNRTVTGAVFKNGTEQTNLEFKRIAPLAGATEYAMAAGILLLASSDVLDFRLTSSTNGDVVTIHTASLTISRIGA